MNHNLCNKGRVQESTNIYIFKKKNTNNNRIRLDKVRFICLYFFKIFLPFDNTLHELYISLFELSQATLCVWYFINESFT